MGAKVIRDKIPTASGRVFTPDGRVNSLYLNELFDAVAQETSARLYRRYRAEVPMSGGLWGGSWYFTDECGYTRARFRRLYSLVCVPQISALEDADNYNIVFWQYSKALADAFVPYGIALGEVEWGESSPYSHRLRPTIALQMWDANKKIDFIRCFFSYNAAEWEEAYLYETVRLIKQTKETLDKQTLTKPPRLDGMAIRFQLQDIVILYHTLEPVLSEQAKAVGGPLVERIKTRFAQGMSDEEEMNALNAQAFECELIYAYEDAIREDFAKEGRDITRVEEWPVDGINRVPASLKEKLIPHLKGIFQRYRDNLKAAEASALSGKHRGK